MLVRIKGEGGLMQEGTGHCWMGQFGLCTLFLTAGLAGPIMGRRVGGLAGGVGGSK